MNKDEDEIERAIYWYKARMNVLNIEDPEYHIISMNKLKLESKLSVMLERRVNASSVRSKENKDYGLPMPISLCLKSQTDVPVVPNEPASLFEECENFQGNDEENGAKGLDKDYEYFPSNNDDYYDEAY